MSVSRTGTTPTPFGFVGAAQYQTDSDSGLQLLGHRYYDPSIGRFISSDPIQAGDNWYAYCENGPLGKTDSRGLDWLDSLSNISAGAGDWLTGGLTGDIRGGINHLLGNDGDVVNYNGGEYKFGQLLGAVIEIGIDLGGGAEGGGGGGGTGGGTGGGGAAGGGRGGSPGNPFKGKTPVEIDKAYRDKGYTPRGPDPVGGRGGYVNPRTGRSIHIDPSNGYREPPHVDVNRPRSYKGPLSKKKFLL